MRLVSYFAALLLVGCGSCDGERAQHVTPPKPPIAVPGDGEAAGASQLAPPIDAEYPHALGFLDAPPGTLDGFFGGLAAAERAAQDGDSLGSVTRGRAAQDGDSLGSVTRGRDDGGARALMLFFGDSHTAGDSMTSRLRVAWQSRFGDAGRGLVAAGRPPTRHYYQRDVRYGRTGDWTAAVGGAHGAANVEPFGIAGLRVSGRGKGAQLYVETCPDCQAGQSVSQFEILYYAAPDHGIVRYRVDDGAWVDLPTKTSAIEPPHPGRQVVPVVDGPHRLTLEHGGGGQVDLFGIVMERQRPGVIVDSLGVVGRRLGSLRSWDWSIIGEQLSTRDPRLVVLQYGTNEADDPDLVLDDLAKYYDETILRIRAAAPTASILILGPPDMGVREGGKGCDKLAAAHPDAGVTPECEWRTPGVLGEIIAVEHAAAVRNHVAFFDTFAAMGGNDQMGAWATAEPRVAFKDRVHFTDLGYQRWADALTGALLDDYERWKKAQGLPPSARPATPPPAVTTDAPLPATP
ncbi:MAG TPA: GDSL-type esterase/lipase family protein [Kofleriaceae bacterium]|nr:GDSL-type esterase/lipase family protein [Kofleriaceae bacterium]